MRNSLTKTQCFDTQNLYVRTGPECIFDPLIPIIQILQIPNDFRAEKDIKKIQSYLENLSPFSLYLNITNNSLIHNLIVELSKAFQFRFLKKGTIIRKAGDMNNLFILVLKGEITELCVKFDKVTLDKDDFFNYLIKLYLLNEKELLNICINQNKHYFTNEPDITNFYTIVKNKSNEKVQALINKINLEEIKYSNWKVYRNIDDFISLIKVKPTRIKLNCESKPKFLISIPLYEKTKIIRDEGIIGTITPDLKSKLFNAYITSSSVEMCYFNKKELSDEYVYQHMKKIIELSAWDLLSSMYIFQDYNKAEFNKKYSGLFSYRKIQKGELILKQNVHSTGIFFIKNGSFRISTNRNYNELNELISILKKSLSLNYSNSFVGNFTDIKEKDDFSNPLSRTSEFVTKSKENKEITMTITTNKQIFGFNELLHYENEMSLFNVECIEESEAFFISKESFFYLADKNTALKTRCAKLVEEKAKFYIFLIQRYMENFNKDIKKIIDLNPVNFNSRLGKKLKIKAINIVSKHSTAMSTLSDRKLNTNSSIGRSFSSNNFETESPQKTGTSINFYKTFSGNKFYQFNSLSSHSNNNSKRNTGDSELMCKTTKTFFGGFHSRQLNIKLSNNPNQIKDYRTFSPKMVINCRTTKSNQESEIKVNKRRKVLKLKIINNK